MKDGIDNEDVLVRYLLGQLSEEDRRLIEERAFDDDEFYRRLLEVEDDLRCAYAGGTLSLEQKKLFEDRFMIFADERKRVALAREMIGELQQGPADLVPGAASNRSEQQIGRAGFYRVFGSARSVTRYAAAAAALIVVAVMVWLLFETVRLRGELSRQRQERAAAEQQLQQRTADERARAEQLDKQLAEERDRSARLEEELSQREARAGEQPAQHPVVSLFLAPGLIRGGGDTKRLALPAGAEQVRLDLEVTGDISSSYRAAVLNSEGRTLWTRTALRARAGGGRSIISLDIPARILAEDDYELRLAGLDSAGQPERTAGYYFTVLRK